MTNRLVCRLSGIDSNRRSCVLHPAANCLAEQLPISLEGRKATGKETNHVGVPQLAQNFAPGGTGDWQFLQGCGTIDCPQLEQNFAPA